MQIRTKKGEILTVVAFGEVECENGSNKVKCKTKEGKIKVININEVVCFYGSEMLSPDSYN